MTPKDKAKELFNKFFPYVEAMSSRQQDENAKQCVLITVDEMIIQNGEIYLNSLGDKAISFYKAKNSYLFEVKTEIEKL